MLADTQTNSQTRNRIIRRNSKFGKRIKENYSKNLYRTRVNLISIDSSFCERMLEYQKYALEMYPYRRIEVDGLKNSNKDLINIKSIVNQINQQSDQIIDLQYLGLLGIEMTMYIIPAIQNNKDKIKNITKVNLAYKKIGNVGVIALSRHLKELLPNLNIIDLSGNQIGTLGIKQLWELLRGIRIVKLSLNNLSKDSAQYIASFLQDNQKIISIHLHCNLIQGNLKIIILASKTAKNLGYTSYQGILKLGCEGVSQFISNQELKVQSINEQQLKVENIDEFIQLLENNDENLIDICLGDNNLDISTSPSFYEAIRKNNHIRTLALYKSKLNGKYLADCIKNHQSLQSLDVADTLITVEGMLQFENSVAKCKIKTSKIGFNQIGSNNKGIQSINMLLQNPNLETLFIHQQYWSWRQWLSQNYRLIRKIKNQINSIKLKQFNRYRCSTSSQNSRQGNYCT
ncbi:hypothetical protein ABPG72_011617 [Tetrahymena utriculariae]